MGEKVSSETFEEAIQSIVLSNAWVDLRHVLNEEYHFDNESFLKGKKLITDGIASVKGNIRQQNFYTARKRLGQIFHTLQDFYSHSNWIELGYKTPFSNLIQSSASLENIASKGEPTCSDCAEGTCPDNTLESILQGRKLTSGYFDLRPWASKPTGKCSHGGLSDFTSDDIPRGGISKDTYSSNHGSLHEIAAQIATTATMEQLQDLRNAAGDDEFLRFMGISRPSVLCFVIDTTGSMFDDIEEAKRRSFSIIDTKRGTSNEPSAYILVPFNDPDFGPVTRTKDPEVFKKKINALTASGGGDEPEMCLSALQLALTSAPPSSEIYVFTDASAKDSYLKSTIIALIESTKSVVSFLLTAGLSRRRRWSSSSQEHGQLIAGRLSQDAALLYQDLAQTSGGQAVRVSKGQLSEASAIISSSAALVTLFQSVTDPGKTEEIFSFYVDPSVSNLTLYITGSFLNFKLHSPAGLSQNSSVIEGPLGRLHAVGNLYTVYLENQTGLWEINVTSSRPCSIKVTGQSVIGFLYSFVQLFQGPHPGLALIEGRPQVGKNATLLVSVTGSESLRVSEVSLVSASGSRVQRGSITPLDRNDRREYLVSVPSVPAGQFSVLLIGVDNTSSTPFQRQSNTQFTSTSIEVKAQANTTLEPGKDFIIPFTVATNGMGETYTINARDDKGFVKAFTDNLNLTNGGSAEGSVTLVAPNGTESGTDVSLTVEVASSSTGNFNYIVLRITVASKVTDFRPPVCNITWVTANCTEDCSLKNWELSANLSDGRGSGIQSVYSRLGNGSLSITRSLDTEGINVTVATYSATCCSPDVEIIAVDAVGNVGTCRHSIRTSEISTTPPYSPTTTTTTRFYSTNTTISVSSSTLSISSTTGGFSFTLKLCLMLFLTITLSP
ncbi:von Willebrand factor A domain-containing protein 7-like [Lepisosteus oculatus]|uniref:von Willebrand factor A domain-containing protein 7-like n=1 Tax=Lepisosteus oculatus TaxID=7918 RepID=UPI0035F50B5A